MSKAVLPGIRMSNRTDRVHVESVCVIPPIFFATFAKPLAKGTAGGRVRRNAPTNVGSKSVHLGCHSKEGTIAK
jgi:hypothetical protein